MDFPNLCIAKSAVDGRIGDSLREAETCHMLREAGIEQGYRTSRLVRRWLYRLGCMLVGLGQWLERFDAPLEGHHPARQSQSAW